MLFDQKSYLFGQHSYIHSNIPFSKSIPNSEAIMPSNRAGFYDHNGTTFNYVPILEAEIRKLSVPLFTHSFSATALSPDTYYRSFERPYRGDPDAVKIVGIGSGEAEIFEFQVRGIELIGYSQGE